MRQGGVYRSLTRESYGRVLYNYFRYYEPGTGRYVTSDPIGLEGGNGTYVYADTNPVKNIDSLGLTAISPPIPLPRPIPIPRPVPGPIDPTLPIPRDGSEDNYKDHCTNLYVRCVQEGWSGDWSCGACQFYCTGMNEVWPFEHCYPGYACGESDDKSDEG